MNQIQKIRAWQRILRDFIIVAVGAFILIHETIDSTNPNLYLIGAGLAALGIPPALRLDERLYQSSNEIESEGQKE